MKRFTVLLVGLLALGVSARAEDAKPAQDLASYLDQLQVKLEHTAQRANQPSSSGSSVVSLRGSKQESASNAEHSRDISDEKPCQRQPWKPDILTVARPQMRPEHRAPLQTLSP